MMEGVPGEMVRRIRKRSGGEFSRRTAALPCRAAGDGPASGPQPGVRAGPPTDGGHPGEPSETTDSAPCIPRAWRLSGKARHATRSPTGRRRRPGPGGALRADADGDGDGREHGRIAHDPPLTHLFLAGVEEQARDPTERPGAPGFKLVVAQLRRAAEPGRGQAVETELAHHPLGVARGHAFDVHFRHRHRQHHGADRPAAGFGRVRIERRAVMAGGLRNVDGDRVAGVSMRLGL